MKLKEIMTREVEVVHPDDSLQAAARKMRTRDVGLLPVCDGDQLVGALSDRDITMRATAEGLDPKTTPVRALMTTAVVCCFEDQGVNEAARLMKDNQIRRLIVLNRDDRRLVGIVSLGDLATSVGDNELSGQVLQRVSTPAGQN
jgi:CBS domain-containing protein